MQDETRNLYVGALLINFAIETLSRLSIEEVIENEEDEQTNIIRKAG